MLRRRSTARRVSSTRDATAEKISWIREGAGDRFDDIELEIAAYFVAISEDPADALEAGDFALAARKAGTLLLDHRGDGPLLLILSGAGLAWLAEQCVIRFGAGQAPGREIPCGTGPDFPQGEMGPAVRKVMDCTGWSYARPRNRSRRLRSGSPKQRACRFRR